MAMTGVVGGHPTRSTSILRIQPEQDGRPGLGTGLQDGFVRAGQAQQRMGLDQLSYKTRNEYKQVGGAHGMDT